MERIGGASIEARLALRINLGWRGAGVDVRSQVLTFVYKNLHFLLNFGGAFSLIAACVARQ